MKAGLVPSANIYIDASPHRTAGQLMLCCPDARMGQRVQDIEDMAEALDTYRCCCASGNIMENLLVRPALSKGRSSTFARAHSPKSVTTFSHPLDTTLPTTADVVSVVNVQLMLFWPGDPKFWFTKVEAQFSYRGPHRIPNMMISFIRICSRSARPLVLLQFHNPYSLQNAQMTKPTTLSTF